MGLITEPLAVLAVLLGAVAAADALGRTRWGRPLGGALIVILLGALLANLRIVPPAGDGGPVYDAIFTIVTPAAIFLILLDANLRALRRAGGVLLAAFLIGSAGTALGVFAASVLTPAREMVGASFAPLGGMFAATYIGGSANFNAVALEYGVMQQGVLYASAVVADNVATTVWALFTLVMPVLLYRTGLFGASGDRRRASEAGETPAGVATVEGVLGYALPALLAMSAIAVSNALAAWLKGVGVAVPSSLIVTTLALATAQIPGVERLTHAKPLGLLASFLFLAVVGASADIGALIAAGRLGLVLLAFVGITIGVHGLVAMAGGWLLRCEPEGVAIASNANIGGATSAFALAEALRREDLVLPAVLLGSLGNALGTYAGFAMAALLR